MLQHVNETHCIVGKLDLSKEIEDLIDGIRTGEKRMRVPKIIQVGQSFSDISFSEILCA